jgi:hypothetical protein
VICGGVVGVRGLAVSVQDGIEKMLKQPVSIRTEITKKCLLQFITQAFVNFPDKKYR